MSSHNGRISPIIAKPGHAWLRQILNPARHGQSSERRQFRPRLELLENRQLLSVFLVDNINNGGSGDDSRCSIEIIHFTKEIIMKTRAQRRAERKYIFRPWLEALE